MSSRIKLGLAALAVIGLAVLFWLLPVERWVLDLVQWIRGAGPIGVAVFAAAYILAAVALVPGSILTLGAGFAYGLGWGVALVVPASLAAALAAFALGRTIARPWVAGRMEGRQRFRALDRAVADHGFKVIVLLRLSPIVPYNLLNYALGLTAVTARDYLVASAIGMLPGTVLYVYLGSLVTRASTLLETGATSAGKPGWILYGVGLVAVVVVTMLLTRLARQALRRELDEQSEMRA